MNVGTIPPGGELSPAGFTVDIKKRLNDFLDLDNSLQKGNVSNAQVALTSLRSGIKGSIALHRQPGLSDDLDAIQSTLQVGDVTGARRAFDALKQHLRRTRSENQKSFSEGDSDKQAAGTPSAAPDPSQPPSSGTMIDRVI